MGQGLQIEPRVVDWLPEEDDPAVRYRTLVGVLGRGADDAQVLAAQAGIASSPAARTVLAQLADDGSSRYDHPEQPSRYLSYAADSLSYLADLGLGRSQAQVARAVEHLLGLQREDGDFFKHYSCLNGLILRTLTMLGYGEDERVVRLRELLRRSVRHDGGTHCDMRPRSGRHAASPHKSCIRGSLKALLACADDPALSGAPECERLAQYFLRRHVCFRSGVFGGLEGAGEADGRKPEACTTAEGLVLPEMA